MSAFLTSLALKAGIPQKFAKAAGIAFAVVALIALLAIGKCSYDRSVVEDALNERNAEIAKAITKADREAGAADAERQDTFQNEQDAIEETINAEVTKDPEGAARPVGPASRGYFDSLPARSGDRSPTR